MCVLVSSCDDREQLEHLLSRHLTNRLSISVLQPSMPIDLDLDQRMHCELHRILPTCVRQRLAVRLGIRLVVRPIISRVLEQCSNDIVGRVADTRSNEQPDSVEQQHMAAGERRL